MDCKNIKPVHPKENSSILFIGRTDAEDETPILWPSDVKNWLLGKDPDAGKDWRQEEKWMTEWDGWMASLTQWTWFWVNSRSWWWTGRPGVLQYIGSQGVGQNWPTELNWSECMYIYDLYTKRSKIFFGHTWETIFTSWEQYFPVKNAWTRDKRADFIITPPFPKQDGRFSKSGISDMWWNYIMFNYNFQTKSFSKAFSKIQIQETKILQQQTK